MALTEKRIRDAKPGGKTRIEWDGQVKGLGLRVTAAGAKAFILNYRVDGRERRATLGRPSEMSLSEARERAGTELAAIRQGQADPLARREARQAEPTLADGMASFFDSYVPRRMDDGRMSERTAREYRNQWKRITRESPWFASTRIKAVTRGDVEKALAGRKPVDKNRNLSFLGRVFRYFEIQEWRPQNANPCRLVEKAREEPRDRVLSPDELQGLAAALNALEAREGGDPFPVHAIRFLALTGWRAGEALALHWHHVNFETGEIVLPHTKTGRQTRKIGSDALDLLRQVPPLSGNPCVFAGHFGGAIGYKRLRETFKAACQEAGIEDARLHDLRRSVATYAAASGLSVTLLRDLLGHKTLNMAARYARRADAALQQAQDESAARMAAMMGGQRGNVVPMKRHG